LIGATICKDDAIAERLYFIQNSCGAVPGPMDSFLVLRGIKTLHLRMQRHCENGKVIANFLKNHPKVGDVYWPGFKSHPNHKIAKKQMDDFGGMISFNLKKNKLEDAITVVSNTHYFTLAESLGGVESLCGHPASMTHAAIPKHEREKTGVADSLIRLSVGVEDIEDLIPPPVPVISSNFCTYSFASDCSRSVIKSSISSTPTLKRIKESATPVFSLSCFGIAACVILAGCPHKDSTPPKLSAKVK
jgi:hypothetical protein